MANATVRWIGGKQFIGIDSTNHSVVLSTPDEGVGMKPSELLLVALAACTAVDVVEILRKKRMELSSLEIRADGEQLLAKGAALEDQPHQGGKDIGF